MNKIQTKDKIISNIITYLEDNFKDNIISVFGIGSYFDKALPSDWNITDIDVIVVVKSLNEIPKLEWTEVFMNLSPFRSTLALNDQRYPSKGTGNAMSVSTDKKQ